MRALIASGGVGSRLRPLTSTIHKSLLPVANRPFLEHQVRALAAAGVTDVIVLTGHLYEQFEPFAERMAAEAGVTVELSREDEPLGTAGCVRAVLDRMEGPTLVLNADVLTDLDYAEVMAAHRERGAAVTLTLARVDDATGYGLVPLHPDGRVEAFREKPGPEVAARGGLINAGAYVVEPRVIEPIPPGTYWMFETDVFPPLLEQGEAVYGFPSDAYWLDIGTPDRFRQAHRDILDGRVTYRPAGRIGSDEAGGPVLLGDGASVAAEASAGPYVSLGPGAAVLEGASVSDTVMMAGARIEAGATVRRCIMGPGSSVAAGQSLEDAILGEGERAG